MGRKRIYFTEEEKRLGACRWASKYNRKKKDTAMKLAEKKYSEKFEKKDETKEEI